MEPKGGRKPINVLAEFLTSWIRENSEEALPFDSFESLRPRRVAQKDVERWIFNCNYIYSRVGDFFYDENLLPDDPSELAEFIRSIEQSFKAISDNTPLDLRSKPSYSVIYELSKDWPPFCSRSRNTLGRFQTSLERFRETEQEYAQLHGPDMDRLASMLADEALFYTDLDTQIGSGPRSIIAKCKALLPIWCAKEINPIVTLLIWTDEKAIKKLIELLCDAFAAQTDRPTLSAEAMETWREATLQALSRYIDGIDDDNDLCYLSVREISKLLESSEFTLDHGSPSARLPRWLLGKSQLIWNIVICSILGPEEAIGPESPRRSSTAAVRSGLGVPPPGRRLDGEVLLRRHFGSGRIETVDRLMVDNVQASGLWKVIGSQYDFRAPLPDSAYRRQYAHLGAAYISSRLSGPQESDAEGRGDSRFHAELSLRQDQASGVSIMLRDLDSKNGTFVVRRSSEGLEYYAFPSRRRLSASDWAGRLDVPEDSVHVVHELSLERGDIIHLATSCFEII